jgi:hypothetical protein
MLKINRWRFPQYKKTSSQLKNRPRLLVLVAGRKPRYGVQVDKLWIIDPTDDEES